eukprot:9030623-Pyramimonas_sp.AAC.1
MLQRALLLAQASTSSLLSLPEVLCVQLPDPLLLPLQCGPPARPNLLPVQLDSPFCLNRLDDVNHAPVPSAHDEHAPRLLQRHHVMPMDRRLGAGEGEAYQPLVPHLHQPPVHQPVSPTTVCHLPPQRPARLPIGGGLGC